MNKQSIAIVILSVILVTVVSVFIAFIASNIKKNDDLEKKLGISTATILADAKENKELEQQLADQKKQLQNNQKINTQKESSMQNTINSMRDNINDLQNKLKTNTATDQADIAKNKELEQQLADQKKQLTEQTQQLQTVQATNLKTENTLHSQITDLQNKLGHMTVIPKIDVTYDPKQSTSTKAVFTYSHDESVSLRAINVYYKQSTTAPNPETVNLNSPGDITVMNWDRSEQKILIDLEFSAGVKASKSVFLGINFLTMDGKNVFHEVVAQLP